MRTLPCYLALLFVLGPPLVTPPPGFGKDDEKSTKVPAEQRTYLGVSTFYLSPSLREYLEIPEGFGIQIMEVLDDSPAAKAGMKEKDILLRFNDQLLISPEHLSLLVKQEKPSRSVTLVLLRKGAEEEVTVTLGAIDPQSQRIRPRPESHRLSPDRWQEHLKKQQDYWQHWMSQRQPERDPGAAGKKDKQALQKPEGRPPAVSVSPGFPVQVFGTDGVLKIDNEEGEVAIFREEDGHRIVIQNAEGKEVFSGDYDSKTGLEGLPEDAQEHLRQMKLENLEILAPQATQETPKRTFVPMPPAPQTEPEVL